MPATDLAPALAFDKNAQHERKRQELLDEAALLFNRKGYSGTTLEELAGKLGLTKAALYYYVKGKEDLGYRSYVRTLESQRGYIDAADRDGADGLDAVARYIRYSCNSANRPAAIPTEVAALNPDHRRTLEGIIRDNTHALRRLIERGQNDGSIQPTHPAIAAMAIVGALSWIPQWYARNDAFTPDVRLEAIGAGLADVFVNGLATGDQVVAPLPPAAPAAGPSAFDRRRRNAGKLDALLRAATEAFNRQGVNGTSLDQVVGALNVTKGAFYHHIRSKDDLLFRCYERTLAQAEGLLDRAASAGDTGWSRIAAAMRLAIKTHCGGAGPLAIFVGIKDLSPERQNAIAKRATRLHRRTHGFITDGMADGSMHQGDPDIALAAVIGATIWLPKWYAADGVWSPADIAGQFAGLLGRGLRRRG